MPGYEYGRWVPTGTTDRVEAEDYLTSYNSEGLVAIEWLLM
jgi:hypothetical protein